jgi:general stress protein YciG
MSYRLGARYIRVYYALLPAWGMQFSVSEICLGMSNENLNGTEKTMSNTNDNNSGVSVTEIKPRRPRGFAAMDRSRVSEIASKGGKAAHAAGTAHQFNRDEAIAAGRKGGIAPHVRRGRGAKAIMTDDDAPVTERAPVSKVA